MRRALTLSSVAIQACDTTAPATSSVNTAFAARGYSDVLASSRNPGPRRRHPDRLRGPLPKTQTCPDGSAIDTTATCPPPPPPVPIELGERGQWADRTNGRAAPLWVGQTQGSAKLLTGRRALLVRADLRAKSVKCLFARQQRRRANARNGSKRWSNFGSSAAAPVRGRPSANPAPSESLLLDDARASVTRALWRSDVPSAN